MGIGIDDIEQLCLECGRRCVNRRSLGNHVARSHCSVGGLHAYVLKHMTGGVTPACKCGCGREVEWCKTSYCFNDYVNGHNCRFSSENQPSFTREQIDVRNDAIRRSYEERSGEIREKISKSVIAAFQRPESIENLSRARKILWQDPEFRARQHVSRVASWSGEAGEDRRRRVFTPEFGRKIGLANMRRDSRRTSGAEARFVQALIDRGFAVEPSKWFNFDERVWCADAWLPEHSAIVEFDGTYWHARDRTGEFTRDQLVNVANDIAKNDLARERGLTLLRIDEGTDISGAMTFDDLVSLSYHAVIGGEVIKEGTFKIDEHAPLVSRETLIRTNEVDLFPGAAGREWTRNELLPVFRNLFQAHVVYWGWFYPTSDERLSSVLESVARAVVGSALGDNLCVAHAGTSWLKAFSVSYWNVDGGPVQATLDDKRLEAVLRYRLGLNDSRPYTYTLSDGSSVTCRETFDINLHNVRGGIIVQRNCVSWFKPVTAADVYARFLRDVRRPVVWDPSGGFGARMLGFSSICDQGTYVCCEPAELMHRDLLELARVIKKERPGLEFDVRRLGSEMCELGPESCDLVFTSPPYFDREKYVDEPGQCWRDYPDIDSWTRSYLLPTISNAFACLRPGAVMVLNVDAPRRDLVVDVATAVGFSLEMTLRLKIGRDHFNRKAGYVDSDRAEPVLVFRKAPC